MKKRAVLIAVVAAQIYVACSGDEAPEIAALFAPAPDSGSDVQSGDEASTDAGSTDAGSTDAGSDNVSLDARLDVDIASDAGDADVEAAVTLAIGESCSQNSDCSTGICGTSTLLTTAVVANGKGLCTRPCCRSEECPTSFICLGAGTGGNYCAPSIDAGRPSPGVKPAGDSCAQNADCRSALCQNNRCLDTCCKASDCATGTACRIVTATIPSPGHDIWGCQPPETGATGTSGTMCPGGNGECISNACIGIASGKRCRQPCCTELSCVGLGGQCSYGQSGNDYFPFCSSPTGAMTTGSACQIDTDCQSHFCDPSLKKCVSICCGDGDCPAGEACRPSPTGTPLLRCVAK